MRDKYVKVTTRLLGSSHIKTKTIIKSSMVDPFSKELNQRGIWTIDDIDDMPETTTSVLCYICWIVFWFGFFDGFKWLSETFSK